MAEDIFNKLTENNPDRQDEIEDDNGLDDVGASASQRESESPNDSDLESILKRLFPSFDDEDIQKVSQVIMLGRVFPDNFSNKVYLIVTAIALKHYNDPKFDVILTMMQIEGLCQIGLEGKGRVEAVIVSGNTKEQAEQESNKMGNF
jgi:hypothetical protein